MEVDRFVEQVRERCGLTDCGQAQQAIEVTLETLGERLDEADAVEVAADLGEPLATLLRRRRFEGEFSLPELYDRVSHRAWVAPGFAIEHTQVVFQVLAEAVTPRTLKRLHAHLPREMAELFRPRPPSEEPIHHRVPRPRTVAPGTGRTLADGRPGSYTPIADAQGELAHTGSVVASENPHADTKLSSGGGPAQDWEPIAEGTPFSKHPVSESE
jgi:uncharacterized protein (DUF2267 family)